LLQQQYVWLANESEKKTFKTSRVNL